MTKPIQAEFLELSITALTKRIEQIFGFNCSFVLGEYDRRAEAKSEGDIKYPYSNIRLTNVNKRDDGMNRTATAKYGFKTIIEQSGQNWIKFHGRPVKLDLAFRIVFGDQQDLFKALHNFFIKETHFSFVLDVSEGAFTSQHNVLAERALSVPQIEESEYGNNLPLETVLQLNTWVGELYTVPVVVTYRGSTVVVNDSNINEVLGDAEVLETRNVFERVNAKINPIVGVG